MAEYKNGKLQLPRVTLAALTSVNLYETVRALRYSCRGIDFGDVVLISDRKPWYLPRCIRFSETSRLDSIDKFNYKMVYELKDHIHTDYVLLVHADGFIVHPEKWEDDFLSYDYIGSPWPLPDDDVHYRDGRGNIVRVGNCVGIRSMRLLRYPAEHHLPWVRVYDNLYNEDIFLCCYARNEMEDAGLRWAPLEVAARFGREHPLPENAGVTPFLFHKWRGENASFPRFRSPDKRLRDAVRPLLFWRHTKAWKTKHGANL